MLLPRNQFHSHVGRPACFGSVVLREKTIYCSRPATEKAYYIYMALSLDRDMTHPAMTEYLESQPTLAPLAADLNDTVDGNVLIDAVKLWKSASPAAIKPYFKEESPIGALGALAQRLHLFLVTEAEVEKQNTSHKKYDLCAEKQAKLLKAIAEERKSAVGPEALNLSVQALAASAEAAVLDKHKKKRFMFEKEGAVFKFKVPLEAPQAHFKYFLENKETCLGLIDARWRHRWQGGGRGGAVASRGGSRRVPRGDNA